MSAAMLRPFDLNLRHLRSLVAVGELGTLGAAAARIGLSQPALTQGLAKLERQLGIALFDRRPAGLVATPAGAMLAERVAAAMRELSAMSRGLPARQRFARPEQLMTATQLDAFLALADAGSFVAAAALRGLSQPALHRAVRELEQVTGAALVERSGRGSALTAAGRRLARGVRLAERELAAGLAEAVADPKGGGRIVVGAMPLSRALVLPRALAAFTAATPGTAVEVVEGAWRDLIDPLRDGVIDLTIGALRAEPPPGVVQEPLFDDRLAVIARAGHPLATHPAPVPADLAAYPWIVGAGDSPLSAHWQRLFAGCERPVAAIACGSVMVLRGLLRETDHLTLLSPDQVALEIDVGMLTTIGPPLADSIRTIGFTTRMGWRPTLAQAALMTAVRRACPGTELQEIE